MNDPLHSSFIKSPSISTSQLEQCRPSNAWSLVTELSESEPSDNEKFTFVESGKTSDHKYAEQDLFADIVYHEQVSFGVRSYRL